YVSALVVRDTGTRQRGNAVLSVRQRPDAGLEHGQLVDDRLPFGGVAPDADAVMSGWLPGVFVDDDGVPADFPFETGRRHGVIRQFLVVGVLSAGQRHVESELLDPLIRGDHVVKFGDLDVEVLYAGANRVDRQVVHIGDGHRVVALVDPQEAD